MKWGTSGKKINLISLVWYNFTVVYNFSVWITNLCIIKTFLFYDTLSAVAAITFKLIFPKYLAVYQNVSFILKVVIPSVANVPKIYVMGWQHF